MLAHRKCNIDYAIPNTEVSTWYIEIPMYYADNPE